MAQSPSYYVNNPVSGSVYYAPLWAGCIPNSGTTWTVTVKAWSGPNGTGSQVVRTLTAIQENYSQLTQTNSSSGSGNNWSASSSSGTNGSNIMQSVGSFSGSAIGSLEIYCTFTGSLYAPSISSLSTWQGGPGTSVTITGNHFVDTPSVDFNGVGAGFVVNSMTTITATVPNGATTGPVHVVNPAGTAASPGNYLPYSVPSISGFSPSAGAIGTSVTFSGSGFTGASSVSFNGTAASFTLNSDSQITATVPAGATTGPVSVTNPAGTGWSAGTFIVGVMWVNTGTPASPNWVAAQVYVNIGTPAAPNWVSTQGIFINIGTAASPNWVSAG